MKDKIFEIVKYLIVIFAVFFYMKYLIDTFKNSDLKLNKFLEQQQIYENKIDSLTKISNELIYRTQLIDNKITKSKKAIDDLKNKPPVVNFTNKQALQFLKEFSVKYNSFYKDSLWKSYFLLYFLL